MSILDEPAFWILVICALPILVGGLCYSLEEKIKARKEEMEKYKPMGGNTARGENNQKK